MKWTLIAVAMLFLALVLFLPLVAVFVLASKTTDAFQMAKWSSRNVIPAKIALGLVFALLGILVLLGARFLHLGSGIWYNL